MVTGIVFAGLIVGLSVVASGQSLVDADSITTAERRFKNAATAPHLRCSIHSSPLALTYALHFQAGYVIDIPLDQLRGEGHSVNMLLRVTPEGATPVYLGNEAALPTVPATKAEGEFTGDFVVGEGAYDVEALVEDDTHRVCTSKWHIQARPSGSERDLKLETPPGKVEEVNQTDEGTSGGPSAQQIRRLTILLHAAPLSPRASKIDSKTALTFLDSLRSLLHYLPSRSVRLVVFNRDKQVVLLERNGFDATSLDQVSQAFDQLQVAVIDYKTLQKREHDVDVLSDLVANELNGANPADAVILMGPRSEPQLDVSAPNELRPNGAPRWFYLRFQSVSSSMMRRPTPVMGWEDERRPSGAMAGGSAGNDVQISTGPRPAPELADGIGEFVKHVKGNAFLVRTPRDLAEAIHRIAREVPTTGTEPGPPTTAPVPTTEAHPATIPEPPHTSVTETLPVDDKIDPVEILIRLRDQVLAHAGRIPNHTCVETIQRDRYVPLSGRLTKACTTLLEARQHSVASLRLDSTDWLRLDVGVGAGREIYSWAGAPRFEEGDIDDLVPEGAIGTGPFAGMLSSIFRNPNPHFRFEGDTVVDNRSLLEFTFAIPKEESGYRVRTRNREWIITGYSGKLLIDPRTADLVRLLIRTDELPEETGSCEVDSSLEFGVVSIGGLGYLLPNSARQRFIGRDGAEAENTLSFASCRAYRGESNISFGGIPLGATAGGAKSLPSLSLASGQVLTIELATPVQIDQAAAGDRIYGRLLTPLREVPAGATVEGRLMRVEWQHAGREERTIVLRWEMIEIDGAKIPLALKPNRQEQEVKVPRAGTLRRRSIEVELPRPGEERYANYRFPVAQTILESGFRTEWLTIVL
jgi:hypothetical protein